MSVYEFWLQFIFSQTNELYGSIRYPAFSDKICGLLSGTGVAG